MSDAVRVLDFSHSNKSVAVSHCFSLHFPDDIPGGEFFHMLILLIPYLGIFPKGIIRKMQTDYV